MYSASGVLQGLVLGPLLFLLYINNITSLPFSPGTKVILYANDILLYKPISGPSDDFELLQTDLHSLSFWSKDTNLPFNPKKSKFMLVSRKRINVTTPPPLVLCNHIISRVYQFTYLGILITFDLTWGEHTHAVCTKARKMLGLLYRTFYTDSSSSSLLRLYTTVIRPSLEYACQVWDPYRIKDIEKLERFQKFALKICRKKWDLDYSSLLLMSNLPTLASRRKYFRLCTMFKIVNDCLHFNQNLFTLRATPYMSTSSHVYEIPFCRTNAYMNSFVSKTCSDRNLLPLCLRSSETVS